MPRRRARHRLAVDWWRIMPKRLRASRPLPAAAGSTHEPVDTGAAHAGMQRHNNEVTV